MRIGTASFNAAQIDNFNRINDQITADQTAIATGKRRVAPSDDPASAARGARLARTQADDTAYASGLDLAEQRLNVMDTSLGGVTSSLTHLKELALQASSETASPADRQAILAEAQQIEQSLVGLANARDGGGQYLFAGARGGQPAFTQDSITGAVTYQGLGEAAPVAIGDAAMLATADAGDKVFGVVTGAQGQSVFAIVQSFVTALQQSVAAPGDLAAQRAALGSAIDGLGAAIDSIASLRTSIGARLNRASGERTALDATGVDVAKTRSALDDTDYAATVTSLQRASTILEAAQKTFAHVSSLSLFNEIH